MGSHGSSVPSCISRHDGYFAPHAGQNRTLETGMTKRVTLMMDDELGRKIREYQAEVMLERNKAHRYSDAVNDILTRGV